MAESRIVFRSEGYGIEGRLQGAGVGLAISKRIAEELGGDLTVSVNDDGQTRFRLTLPPATNGVSQP